MNISAYQISISLVLDLFGNMKKGQILSFNFLPCLLPWVPRMKHHSLGLWRNYNHPYFTNSFQLSRAYNFLPEIKQYLLFFSMCYSPVSHANKRKAWELVLHYIDSMKTSRSGFSWSTHTLNLLYCPCKYCVESS